MSNGGDHSHTSAYPSASTYTSHRQPRLLMDSTDRDGYTRRLIIEFSDLYPSNSHHQILENVNTRPLIRCNNCHYTTCYTTGSLTYLITRSFCPLQGLTIHLWFFWVTSHAGSVLDDKQVYYLLFIHAQSCVLIFQAVLCLSLHWFLSLFYAPERFNLILSLVSKTSYSQLTSVGFVSYACMINWTLFISNQDIFMYYSNGA